MTDMAGKEERGRVLFDGIGRKALDLCYGAVFLLVVVSYGANSALVLSLAASAAFLLLFVAFFVLGEPSTARMPFWTAFALLCALAVWTWLQTVPLPGYPGLNAAWTDVAGFPAAETSSVSVTAGDAMLGLLKIALPFGMFMLSLILFDRDERAVSAFKFVALAGGAIAIFALLQFLLFPGFLLVEQKQFYRDSLTGTFVNRNTAGTFFGLVSVMLFALAFHAVSKLEPHRLWRLLDRGGKIEQPREVWSSLLFGALFLASISALFLTKSRAATGAAFIALLVLALLMAFGPKLRRSRGASRTKRQRVVRRLAAAIVLIAVPALIFATLGGRVQLRAEEQASGDPRFCAVAGIWSATVDNWPLGAGLTSFEQVYPAYRDPRCGALGVWDKAHDFYLEGLFSLGAFFPVALLVVCAAIARTFFTGLKTRKSRRYIVAAGVSGTLLVAIHAAFDFSLQIPGMAVFFAAMLGPVTTVCLGRSKAKRPSGTVY